MKDPDEKLIADAKRGKKKAFGELVNRYYEMVYAVSYGVVREREAARDVAQEVFLKAYRQIKKFEGKSKFKTWIYRIAMNAAIDATRKRRPADSLDATDARNEDDGRAPVIIHEKGPGPREQARQAELREVVAKALEELSPEHRAVLVLREWQGLSYDEIAESLEIETGTVMSRLFYARKKLAEVLKPRMQEIE